MRVIFCDSVVDRKVVESLYADECKAAQAVGASIDLISHEALVDDSNGRKSISLVKASEKKVTGVYRGWMMRPKAYEQLYEGLLLKNIELINSPEEYSNGHLFPQSYGFIESHTPKSVVIPREEIVNVAILQQALKNISGAAIVKDYVKSLKHHWKEACFIPDSSDWESAQKIIHRFLEIQGSSLLGGLVLREYVALRKIADHSKSGMPLSEEYRIFFLRGEVLQIIPYWDEGTYEDELTIPGELVSIGKKISSNFFTMDIARKENGEWIIMELGDGQVAGLPDQTNLSDFYRKLIAEC